ncbi:MAG: hypothetical protein RBU21_05780 [FCB group bacterium]|jgi:hypothetical protein|nr:hypothetical protein [FCB group bacterium]
MKVFNIPIRTRILLGLLAVVAAGWVQITVYTWRLERSLKTIAEAKTIDLNMHLNALPADPTAIHLIPQVTVAREYLVFGTTTGKVHILIRTESQNGKVKFGAFDYYFTRHGDSWRETDSGFCGDGEMQTEGRAVFASLRQ